VKPGAGEEGKEGASIPKARLAKEKELRIAKLSLAPFYY
jgi:hypothetical protein